MKKTITPNDAIIFDNAFCDFRTGQLLAPIETQNYVIVQVTESYYRNSFQVNKHLQHCDFELTFPLTNGLSCAADDIWVCTDKHMCYLSFGEESHALAGPKGSRFQTLALNVKEGPHRQLFCTVQAAFHARRVCLLPDLSTPLSSIIAEFLTPDAPFSGILLDSLITDILVKLARFSMDAPKQSPISTDDKLPAIINYIDSNVLTLHSLEALSDHFGYTYGHICKTFRKTYGITPNAYLLRKKMDCADALHREGKTLSQIAEILGYTSAYNLSRAFKKIRGCSPQKYWKEQT